MHQTQEQIRFSTLLQQNRGVVYGVINAYCRDESAKDDLYQDISRRAWEAFKTFSGASKFSSWIGKIARNTAIDRLRRQKSFKTILCSNILWEIPDTEYQKDDAGLPLSVMSTFSEAEQRTLQMRMEGMTFAEISNATGEPVSRLLVRMHRLKNLLSKGSKG